MRNPFKAMRDGTLRSVFDVTNLGFADDEEKENYWAGLRSLKTKPLTNKQEDVLQGKDKRFMVCTALIDAMMSSTAAAERIMSSGNHSDWLEDVIELPKCELPAFKDAFLNGGVTLDTTTTDCLQIGYSHQIREIMHRK